jgi:MGT family glycosyltransferase
MKTNTPDTKPASFLFTIWEGGGVVGPTLNLADDLARRGHRVRVMSDSANRRAVEAAGLAFRSWSTAPNRPDSRPESCPVRDWECATPPETIARVIERMMIGPALAYARDVLEELDAEPADVVVTSEMLLGVMAACESRGQTVAALCTNVCFYPIPGMPTFGPGLPPPRTPEEEFLHASVVAGTVAMFDAGLEAYNRTRAFLGLGPLEHVTDQIHSVDQILLATSRSFDFPVPRLPERLHYIGPQINEPMQAAPWESPWPSDDSRPLIAVGFSTTFQNHAGILQKIIDATADLPVRTLITLSQIGAGELCPAGNSVLVESAPHNAVMREAALVVTHGGHGTVMRALVHHLPMLVIPHGRDQPENAIRVTERGAGLSLQAEADTGEIRQAILRLLGEPAFADAARRLGEAISRDILESPAIPLLEKLSSTRSGRECAHG